VVDVLVVEFVSAILSKQEVKIIFIICSDVLP